MTWITENSIDVQMIQILNEKGIVVGKEPEIEKEKLIDMYKWMVLSRVFDERAVKLQRQGKIGTYAPFSGQEASQIGSAMALEKSDWIFPTYREIGVSLVHGIPASQFFLYSMGHLSGSGKKGVNVFPVQIIIAAQTLHAVGSAWASKYIGENSVSVSYIGDGGTSEGDFHEAMNFAGVYSLPVIFFVQNNQWAISVPRSKQTASKSIAQKGIAYGIESIQVDGNDILAIHETMKQAVDLARTGKPILIEAITYRQGPHTTADDPTKYRTNEELNSWKDKDPLLRMKTYLINKGIWDERMEREEHMIADQKVTEAYQIAMQTPKSELHEVFDNVFHTKSNQLAEQQNSVSKGGISL